MSKRYRPWTIQEDDLVLELAGDYSFTHIGKQLNRDPFEIQKRLKELGIKNVYELTGKFNASELAEWLGVCRTTVLKWIYNKGLPATQRNIRITNPNYNKKGRPYMIDLDLFWKWAKKHPKVLDFRKIPETSLYNAPNWVWEMRKEKRLINLSKLQSPWTTEEDNYLLWMIRGEPKSVESLANHLKRSIRSVEEHLFKLAQENKFKISIRKGHVHLGSFKNRFRLAEEAYKKTLKELITEWYCVEKLTQTEIARRIGYKSGVSKISNLLRDYGIPIRDRKTPYEVVIGNTTLTVEEEKYWHEARAVLKIPQHPFRDEYDCVNRGRVMMERHIGRFLYPYEKLQYQNGDCNDHRIENLVLEIIQREHSA